jgi:hypothetical protein
MRFCTYHQLRITLITGLASAFSLKYVKSYNFYTFFIFGATFQKKSRYNGH